MTRNTVKRVEVASPVYDPAIRARIQGIFDLMLSDNKKAREENTEGVYTLVKCDGEPVNSQEALYQEAYDKAAQRNAGQTPEGANEVLATKRSGR